MSQAATPLDRETVADRLLKGSVKRSYAPVVDIDWDAPLEEGKYFLPPHVLSLYGTPMWESMSEAQRIELSRQESANILSVGIWFENILNQALLRALLHSDPASLHTRYVLTEMGDECRHMTMFGRAIERIGAKPYQLRRHQALMVNLLPKTFRGTMLWVAALIGEEIFDATQRRVLDDPQLQPMISRLMQIHVTEESRHIRFAREGVRRRVAQSHWIEQLWVGTVQGIGGPLLQRLFTNPVMYARAGLDPEQARRQALANPYFRENQRRGFESLAAFLEENGLMRASSRAMWRRGGFL
ncbi:AurF N-oxygenase family protein [Rhodococcus maanshanensis]|uniref:p-aminobenzoate N-oxygenase AurF n=1 Tax=Rhodococcus maanshanensis TaxID=183556 RepID=A0A1H7NKA7_9NOCA|nr:diiron oxygenase [Rhodococcus maanshanensis]SEL23771.1 P-aminobenzoate N-oxygenase AurF [Rhodococcus maanshanensis]